LINYVRFDKKTNPNSIPGLQIFLPTNSSDYDFNVIGSLIESCLKCKKHHEFVEDEKANPFGYLFFVEGRSVAKAVGTTKKEAKRLCAENALKTLRECQEVIYKDEINHDAVTEIGKSNLVKASFENAPKIADDNMGSKLLKKMGWAGSGGVGKFGDGISEPVFVDGVENRAGFGHQFEDRSVRKGSVENTLLEFIKDNSQKEIKFAKDLSREDRALVHRLCQKYHLKHKSFGKNAERYLVVSK